MNIPMDPIRLAGLLTVQMLPKSAVDFTTLAAIGAPVIAVILEITAKARKKIFYDKLAQQVAALSLILYFLFILCIGGSAVYFSQKLPWIKDWFINPASPLMMLYLTLAIAVIGLLPYKYTWKKFKKNKIPHVLMGIIGLLGGAASVHVATVIMKLFFTLQAQSAAPAVQDVPFYSHFTALPGNAELCLTGIYLVMALSFAATASGFYLVLRRNKDDFGRDYYKFALPVIARWALFPTLALLAAVAGVVYYMINPNFEMIYTDITAATAMGSFLFLVAVCCAIWIVTWVSETPMRHKIGLAFAPFLMIIAHGALLGGAMKLYLTLAQ
ncbi:hypothetical protein [Maridesulfovibrio sp.]|uniref:hypothetical protein n=1 Tax=Maridesulfovibrio sp. TaxID=2795000 RepID=UPI002A1885C0|nr:hypothetical protein [Maridesulfovibrio sp.]